MKSTSWSERALDGRALLRAFCFGDFHMAQTSINIDAEMAAAMDELRKAFGVTSNAAVLKRAVALARMNARAADSEGSVTVLRPDGREMVLPMKF
jgi:hypothetical protein